MVFGVIEGGVRRHRPDNELGRVLLVVSVDVDVESLFGDVVHALSTLSAERLVPTASPATRRMIKALLEAGEPLGKDELMERADICGKTYYNRIEDLRAIAIVEQDEGGVWRLFVEPWWAAEAQTDEPYLDMTEEMRTAFTREFPEDLLFEIAIQHRASVFG